MFGSFCPCPTPQFRCIAVMLKLYVGNLSWKTTDEVLRDAFSQHGEVVDCIAMRDRDTGRMRGFGFDTFASDDQAQKAIDSMNAGPRRSSYPRQRRGRAWRRRRRRLVRRRRRWWLRRRRRRRWLRRWQRRWLRLQ
ncbi:hypothetical protein C8R47DRAFT_552288 [Mycena vitilis]|nr:hypothetical protein C8R47DRAFT_552288 [Mycena vitilis]